MSIPFIDLKKQYQSRKEQIDSSIHKVLDHGQYIMGPEVKELEHQLADYVDVKHCLTCSSGTDALILPLMAYELTSNDAVFTSPFTFFASAESISLAGATPVFVDIDPHTYNIDPASLEQEIEKVVREGKLTPKGILTVDLFGLSADYDAINEIAKKHNLFVLEDSAQSFAADYKGSNAGSLGDVAATSFYPAKPLGCYGDGGAVFTNDSDMYQKLLSLRVHGQATSGNKYDNIRIGLNARMDTLQAAILLEKLKFYSDEVELRNTVARQYSENLGDKIKTPTVPQGYKSVWAQYSIQVENREHVLTALKDNGIPAAVFYPIPIHLSTAYMSLGYKKGDFPVSEKVSNNILSLPMHPYLETDVILKICDCLNIEA